MADKEIDLSGSLWMLAKLVVAFGIYKFLSLIYLLFIGATANVASSGNIAVPDSINTTINTTINSVNSGMVLLIAGDAVILGLIGLVVILKLFAPFIKGKLSGSKGTSGGFN